MIEIYYSPKFKKMYKKLPQKTKESAEQKEKIFLKNPFDPRLNAHKLHGKLKKYWAFSIDYNYRIIFSFATKTRVNFLTVGNHNIY